MWGRTVAAALVLAWAAVACGRTGLFVFPPEEGTDAATTPDARNTGPDAPAPDVSDVTGNVVVHFSTDTGVVDQGLDLTSTDIVAYAELGDGGFATVNGTGNADGSFVVRAVPNGPFQLRVGTTVLVHPPRSVVVDYYAAGRPDATFEYVGADLGAVHVDNVAPWQPWYPYNIGELMILSSNAASTGLLAFKPDPPPGATSIDVINAELTLDYAAIDSTRGDRATLVQWNTRNDAGSIGTESLFVRAMDLPNPMFGMYQSFTIAGTLQPVPASQTISTAWDSPGFLVYAPRLAPGGATATRGMGVVAAANAQPPGVSLPVFIANRRRTYGSLLVNLIADANDTGTPSTLSFGNPFPSWSLWAYAAFDVTPTLTAPDIEGGTYSTKPKAGFTRFTPLASFGASPLEPMLTPPGDVRIDGADALGALPPVGATPTFTWTAAMSLDPAFGGGRLTYVVTLQPMTSDPDVSSYLFSTGETHLVVPPGRLQQGVSYYATVEALASPGSDPANPAYDTATVVTSVFTP